MHGRSNIKVTNLLLQSYQSKAKQSKNSFPQVLLHIYHIRNIVQIWVTDINFYDSYQTLVLLAIISTTQI